MKKLLAAAVALAPALALLPAVPASASNVCLPITIDGQPVCQDISPVEDAVAQAQATLVAAEALVVGTAVSLADDVVGDVTACRRIETPPSGINIYLSLASHQFAGDQECSGYELSIRTQSAGLPVHIPQVCVTTTNTCIGPVDETIPAPDLAQPLEVCIQRMFWYRPVGSSAQWTDVPLDGDVTSIGCVDVP